MNVGQSIWDRLFRLVLALLVVAGVLGIALWYKPVIQENQRMREEKLALDGKIEKENETARKLGVAESRDDRTAGTGAVELCQTGRECDPLRPARGGADGIGGMS